MELTSRLLKIQVKENKMIVKQHGKPKSKAGYSFEKDKLIKELIAREIKREIHSRSYWGIRLKEKK